MTPLLAGLLLFLFNPGVGGGAPLALWVCPAVVFIVLALLIYCMLVDTILLLLPIIHYVVTAIVSLAVDSIRTRPTPLKLLAAMRIFFWFCEVERAHTTCLVCYVVSLMLYADIHLLNNAASAGMRCG